MKRSSHRIAFGPIPSRRLGNSLGINNVVTKVCSYACVYCQVGPTTDKRVEPRSFFSPRQIYGAVAAHLEKVRAGGQRVDFLTFVPDGEPTLDRRLGDSIAALAPLGLPVAVITNSSLLWRPEVRRRLAAADLVSVKVDTVDPALWRRINTPHHSLDLEQILDGLRQFAAGYRGTLISETMLLAGLNDGRGSLLATAAFLATLPPRVAYLAVPTRPPTVAGTEGAGEEALTRAYELFSAQLPEVEILTGHETGPFAHTGDAREDLLAITAVHPMRQTAVEALLAEDHASWPLVENLLAEGTLKAVDYHGERFYLRPVGR